MHEINTTQVIIKKRSKNIQWKEWGNISKVCPESLSKHLRRLKKEKRKMCMRSLHKCYDGINCYLV